MTRIFKFVAELPPAETPWQIILFGDSLICANDKHAPQIIYFDGRVEPVDVVKSCA